MRNTCILFLEFLPVLVALVCQTMEGLRLPQAVQRIAEEGTCLQWISAPDSLQVSFYEVTDGALFQERFNALRRRRLQSADGQSAAQRSFSGMHRHFALLSGDGWAHTGSKFCLKPDPRGGADSQARFARRGRKPAAPKASSWFFHDVKYCYLCGQGSTSEAQQKCSACNGSEWTLAAGESKSVIRSFLTHAKAEIASLRQSQNAAAHQEADYIVTASQQEALLALKAMVAAAVAAEARQGGKQSGSRKCIWDLRGVHLGAGICVAKTRNDLFLAFIMWAEQEAGRFNVSKAMRRLQTFAEYQEEHFEHLREPIELAELAEIELSDEGRLLSLPLSKTTSGHRALVFTCEKKFGVTPESCRRTTRFIFGVVLCLSFDDLTVTNGVVSFQDLSDASFSNIVESGCGGVGSYTTLWLQAAPLKFVHEHIFVSSSQWWVRWGVNIYTFLGWTEPFSVHYSNEEGADVSSYFDFEDPAMVHRGAEPFARCVASSPGRCWVDYAAQPPGDDFFFFSSSRSSDSSSDSGLLSPTVACAYSFPHSAPPEYPGLLEMAPCANLEDGAAGDSQEWKIALEVGVAGDGGGEGRATPETWMASTEMQLGLSPPHPPKHPLPLPASLSHAPFWRPPLNMAAVGAGNDTHVLRERGPLTNQGTGGGVVAGARGGVEDVSPAVSCLGPAYPPQAGGAAKGPKKGQRAGVGAGDEEDEVSTRLLEYAALHMNILPCEFKATALARVRDLHELLRALEARGTVRTQAAVRMQGATSRHAASVCLDSCASVSSSSSASSSASSSSVRMCSDASEPIAEGSMQSPVRMCADVADAGGKRAPESAMVNVTVLKRIPVMESVTVTKRVTESIFGFSRLFVCDVDAFNAGVRDMVAQVYSINCDNYLLFTDECK